MLLQQLKSHFRCLVYIIDIAICFTLSSFPWTKGTLLNSTMDNIIAQVVGCDVCKMVVITGIEKEYSKLENELLESIYRSGMPISHYRLHENVPLNEVYYEVSFHLKNQHACRTTFIVTNNLFDFVIKSGILAFNESNRNRLNGTADKTGLLWLHWTKWLIFTNKSQVYLENYISGFSNPVPMDHVTFVIHPGNISTVANHRNLHIRSLVWRDERSRREFIAVSLSTIMKYQSISTKRRMKTKRYEHHCYMFPNSKYGFNQRRLIINTKTHWGFFLFIMQPSNRNETPRYSGFLIDILNLIAMDMNFTFTLTPEPKESLQPTWSEVETNVTSGLTDFTATAWSFSWLQTLHDVSISYPVVFDVFTGVYLNDVKSHHYDSRLMIFAFEKVVYLVLFGFMFYIMFLYVIIVWCIYRGEDSFTPCNPFQRGKQQYKPRISSSICSLFSKNAIHCDIHKNMIDGNVNLRRSNNKADGFGRKSLNMNSISPRKSSKRDKSYNKVNVDRTLCTLFTECFQNNVLRKKDDLKNERKNVSKPYKNRIQSNTVDISAKQSVALDRNVCLRSCNKRISEKANNLDNIQKMKIYENKTNNSDHDNRIASKNMSKSCCLNCKYPSMFYSETETEVNNIKFEIPNASRLQYYAQELVVLMFSFFGSIMNQAYLPNPSQMSARIVLFVWSFAMVIHYSIYTGSLTAKMIKTDTNDPISSFEQLANQNDFKWGTTDGSILDKVLKKSKSGVLKRLNDGKSNIPQLPNEKTFEVVKSYMSNDMDKKMVLLHFKSMLQHIIRFEPETSKYVLMKKSLVSANQGFLFVKDSELNFAISQSLRTLHESGMIERLFAVDNYIGPIDDEFDENGNDNHTRKYQNDTDVCLHEGTRTSCQNNQSSEIRPPSLTMPLKHQGPLKAGCSIAPFMCSFIVTVVLLIVSASVLIIEILLNRWRTRQNVCE